MGGVGVSMVMGAGALGEDWETSRRGRGSIGGLGGLAGFDPLSDEVSGSLGDVVGGGGDAHRMN